MQEFIQKHRIKLIHLSFWAVYFSFFLYQISFGRHKVESFAFALRETAFHVSFIVLIAYINYAVLLPRYLKERSLFRYFLEFLPVFTLVIGSYVILRRIDTEGTPAYEFFSSTKFIVQHSLGTFFIVIFVALMKFVEDWFDFESRKREIENEQLNSELRFLKEQINPHFLFNTLNNLYYLAVINSPNTPGVIEKLSHMMRYMLYDSNHPKVSLVKEIEYMKNYISLEKLRLNNELPINFDVNGNVADFFIVPLILNTFLENAFKHGLNNNSKDAFVNISIRIQGNNCLYCVENSKPAIPGKPLEKSGIGLQNVKRRLDLSYPDKYDLKVEENETSYKVTLNVTLV